MPSYAMVDLLVRISANPRSPFDELAQFRYESDGLKDSENDGLVLSNCHIPHAFVPNSTLYSSSFLVLAIMFATIPRHNAAPVPLSPTATTTSIAPQRHAIILGWEDVLVPLSLLAHRLGLQPTRQAMESARELLEQQPYLKQVLATIEEQTIALLSTAASLGPVFIVTEKSLKYMEILCAVFFPRLGAFLLQANMPGAFTPQHLHLHQVRVISPPRKFGSAAEVATWKTSVYQGVCTDQLQRDARFSFSLITVSTSANDAMLCVGAAQKTAPALAVPKCVQVADPLSTQDASTVPSLEGFYAQLQTLEGYLTTVASHSSAFSTHL